MMLKKLIGLLCFDEYITIRTKDMAYKISDQCIKCGACAAACPANCISEGANKYEIDAAACLNCGTCKNTCPVGAPEAE